MIPQTLQTSFFVAACLYILLRRNEKYGVVKSSPPGLGYYHGCSFVENPRLTRPQQDQKGGFLKTNRHIIIRD